MIKFKTFLSENFDSTLLTEAARKSSFNDEHAFTKVWNHSVSAGKPDAKSLSSEVTKAQSNPKHPLSFESHVAKHGAAGFKGGTDLSHPETKEHYYGELHKAAKTVGGLTQHADFAKAHAAGHTARVVGDTKSGTLSDRWKSHGATDTTSKSDVHIGSEKKPHAIRMSYKDSGGSQLAAAGPEQSSATVEHASHKLMTQKGSGYTQKHHEQVMGHMTQLAKHMNAARSASNETQREASLKKAQSAHASMMAVHPGLAHHIAHEAATGEGQFGAGSSSTATHIVSSHNAKTGETKVIRAKDFGASHVAKMRVSKGKGMSGGKYRTHLFRMDLRS